MNDKACGLFLNGELFLPRHCCRLVKTVENAAAVELRCLRISAQSVNISQVSIKILTTVKNVEFVGKEHDQFYCAKRFFPSTCL